MSYNFTQVINKLTNGKEVTRPSWPSGTYIFTPLNIDGVLLVYPNNKYSPTTLYYPTLSDLNATDWIDAA
jgi:hypothetical protein